MGLWEDLQNRWRAAGQTVAARNRLRQDAYSQDAYSSDYGGGIGDILRRRSAPTQSRFAHMSGPEVFSGNGYGSRIPTSVGTRPAVSNRLVKDIQDLFSPAVTPVLSARDRDNQAIARHRAVQARAPVGLGFIPDDYTGGGEVIRSVPSRPAPLQRGGMVEPRSVGFRDVPRVDTGMLPPTVREQQDAYGSGLPGTLPKAARSVSVPTRDEARAARRGGLPYEGAYTQSSQPRGGGITVPTRADIASFQPVQGVGEAAAGRRISREARNILGHGAGVRVGKPLTLVDGTPIENLRIPEELRIDPEALKELGIRTAAAVKAVPSIATQAVRRPGTLSTDEGARFAAALGEQYRPEPVSYGQPVDVEPMNRTMVGYDPVEPAAVRATATAPVPAPAPAATAATATTAPAPAAVVPPPLPKRRPDLRRNEDPTFIPDDGLTDYQRRMQAASNQPGGGPSSAPAIPTPVAAAAATATKEPVQEPVDEKSFLDNEWVRLGLNMMVAASKPGATALGAFGEGAMATISDRDKREAINETRKFRREMAETERRWKTGDNDKNRAFQEKQLKATSAQHAENINIRRRQLGLKETDTASAALYTTARIEHLKFEKEYQEEAQKIAKLERGEKRQLRIAELEQMAQKSKRTLAAAVYRASATTLKEWASAQKEIGAWVDMTKEEIRADILLFQKQSSVGHLDTSTMKEMIGDDGDSLLNDIIKREFPEYAGSSGGSAKKVRDQIEANRVAAKQAAAQAEASP